MTYPITLPRHFAQLVRVLLHDSMNVGAQKAALREAVLASRAGPVMLTLDDRRLVANGTALPLDIQGADDLATQMIGHGITQLMVSGEAAPADLLTVARTLAEAPVPGRTGQAIAATLARLESPTVRATLETPIASNGTQPDAAPHINAQAAPTRPSRLSGSYLAFAAVQPRNSIGKTLEELRATSDVGAITHLLEELAVLVEDAAAKGEGEVVAETIVDIVAGELLQPDATRKRAYAMGLKRFGRVSLLRTLAGALPKRRDRMDAYAAALVRMGQPGAEAVIEELVESESMNERRVFFDTLLRLPTALPRIITLLGDSRWYVARNAADLIAEMPTPDAELPLGRLLKHDDDRVRRAAAVALGKVGTASAFSALRAALGDESPQVRLAAAAALGSWKRTTSAQSLTVALDEESDGDVQLQIIATLGRVATPDAIERLIDLARPVGFFKRKSTAVRIAAVHALTEARTPAAIETLQQLREDKDDAVRSAVVQSIATLRSATRTAS
jgi:HEAT repeat protein